MNHCTQSEKNRGTAIFPDLLPIEKKVLEIIILQIGYIPFDWEQLEKCCLDTLAGAELKWGLILLRKRNIVQTVRKTWGEHLYIISRETFFHLQAWMLKPLDHFTQSLDEAEVELIELHRLGMEADLFNLCVHIAKNGLPLTQKGTIHKRHLQKINEIISLKDVDLAQFEMQYMGEDMYPPSFALIFDAALRLGLVENEVGRVVLNVEKVRHWLRLNHAQMRTTLYEMWREVHIPSTIWEQHFITAIEQICSGRWVALKDIFRWLSESGFELPYTLREMETYVDGRWLQPLAGLGWIQRGKTVDDYLSFRWIDPYSVDNHFYVQSDFELIIPPSVSYWVRWEVESIAQCVQFDLVSHYILTKESIEQACASGRNGDEIQLFLQTYSKQGLPENVKITIHEWANQFGQVHFSEVILLRCRHPHLADEIERHPECAPFIRSRIGLQDFIVDRNHVQTLKEVLVKHDYGSPINLEPEDQELKFPRFDQPATENEISIGTESRMNFHSNGLIYKKHAIHFYEPETKIPHVTDMYPDLQEVPQIWLKDRRPYHLSTRKQMIEKAIEWRTYLKLFKEGKTVRFIPKQLQQLENRWIVKGMEASQEMDLSLDQWEEMQLILPGINDIY